MSTAAQERVRTDGAATAVRPPLAEIRDGAAATFRREHPGVRLAPVVVVIAAYDEEDCIGDVLDGVPSEACGLEVDTIVVDDGSSDRTGDVARAHDAYVVTLAHNAGQGSAFRVGYVIAREHGARYIVTLDADGQWDPGDVPAVLEPVVRDEADFVLGSRVLGRAETDDSFRSTGVQVFSGLLRLLTGVEVTDTSSGVRAFRAEVTESVRQEEPQYQASELLVGAICHGYRIAERPVVMRKRAAGESKKGHNVLYGVRYGRVMLRTWRRERRAARNGSRPDPPADG